MASPILSLICLNSDEPVLKMSPGSGIPSPSTSNWPQIKLLVVLQRPLPDAIYVFPYARRSGAPSLSAPLHCTLSLAALGGGLVHEFFGDAGVFKFAARWNAPSNAGERARSPDR
ncbi:Uncharacterised protein [Mycobacterium tuberculosis]|nr:Uncharacterised protein [Mycobacterium tuberculosis]